MSARDRSRLPRKIALVLAVACGVWVGARFFPPAAVRPTSGASVEATTAPASPREGISTAASTPARVDDQPPLSPALTAAEAANIYAAALREPDPVERQRLVLAALRRWAAVDPDAAARATLSAPPGSRLKMVTAVLAGVASRPDDVVRLGIAFCRNDPGWAPDYGRTVIAALAEVGQFPAAVSFALVGVAEVDGEERNKWLLTAFDGWAQREPSLAARAAMDLADGGMRHEALQVAVTAWRKATPDGPEKFIEKMPAGPERAALAAGLAATR